MARRRGRMHPLRRIGLAATLAAATSSPAFAEEPRDGTAARGVESGEMLEDDVRRATGLFVDQAKKRVKRAEHPGSLQDVGEAVAGGIRAADDAVNRGLDQAEYQAHKGVASMTDQGMGPEDVPVPEPRDTLPDVEPGVPLEDRRIEHRAERGAEQAAELTEQQEELLAARTALAAQEAALQPPAGLDAAAVQAAHDQLATSGTFTVGEHGLAFKVGKKKARITEWLGDYESDDSLARAVELGRSRLLVTEGPNNYEQVMARTTGLGRGELSTLIAQVELQCGQLAFLLQVRDAMLAQGLHDTKEYEAVVAEAERLLQQITRRAGHVIFDDPRYGEQSDAQKAKALIQTGSGPAPR